MRNVLINFAFAISIFAFIFAAGTFFLNNAEKPKPKEIPIDSIYYKAFQHKVNELEKSYRLQVVLLSNSKDSLQKIVKGSKKTIAVLKVQSKLLENQIAERLENADSNLIPVDSIKSITLEYIATQQANDSICDTTIHTLEIISTKQDSIIGLNDMELANYRDKIKMNELREQQLTEALNTAYKVQRKAVLKSKICAGAMILLSGFSGAILIKQTLK